MTPRRTLPPYRRLWLAAWAVLGAGLLAAAAILACAGEGADRERAMAYRVIDGKVFTVPLDEHSPELREVMRIGGDGGALIYRFDRWLSSLWHGRRLAATVLVLACGLSLLCFHIANLMREGEDGGGDGGGGGWDMGGGRGGNGGGWGMAVRPAHHGRRRRMRRAHALANNRHRQLPR